MKNHPLVHSMGIVNARFYAGGQFFGMNVQKLLKSKF